MSRIKVLLLSLFIISFSAFSAEEEIPKVLLNLSYQTVEIGGNKYIALNFKNHPHWHTYWKNPGDAGLPIDVEFIDAGKKLDIEALEWPIPQRFNEEGGLQAYGFEKEYTFFYKYPTELEGKDFNLHAKWLICKNICIPGEKEFPGRFNDTFKNGDPLQQEELEARFNQLPQPAPFPKDLDLVLTKTGNENELVLYSNIKPQTKLRRNINLLTPFPSKLFTFKHENLFKDRKGIHYARMIAEWDGIYQEPPLELSKDGNFSSPVLIKFLFANPINGKMEIIEKHFQKFDVSGNQRTENFFNLLKKVDNQDPKDLSTAPPLPEEDKKSSTPGIFYFLLFGFIGGLILNVMPCVLPVISIKLFGLLQVRDEAPGRILKHNLAYTAGVLFTFAVLGGIVLAIQATGESIGWGFQLQSPKFVALMIILLFIFSLNLFGLFEFSTPGGKTLGNLNPKSGMMGDFLGGILATILSTPCSAPFLGTALTFAFSTNSLTLFLIFFSIGLGLASPFILTGFFPGLIKFLPKPGMWMEHIKKFLGLTLLLTNVWLIDVFTAQVDSSLWVVKLNTLLLMLFFAFYLSQKITRAKGWQTLSFLIPIFLFINMMISPLQHFNEGQASTALLKDKTSLGLIWEPWSEAKMKEYADQQEVVFLDFTAKWCFTCKINERLVLETPAFSNLVQRKGVKLLLGDWTKRDPVIGTWLKKQGLVGVPAYFIQKADGTLISLGETISIEEVEQNL